MKLFRENTEIADIEIDEKTTYQEELQGGSFISCDFTLPSLIDIQKDDYTIWRGKKFFAEEVIPVQRKKTHEFDYSFKLFDFYHYLQDALHQFNGKELEFEFFGDLKAQAKLLITSFNKIGKTTLTLGSVPATEPKNLTFVNADCEAVLQQLCKEWGVEFQFTGTILSFAEKVGKATDLVFEFKDGIRNIERKKLSDASMITRLYAFGANKNIPPKYGTKRLKIAPLERNTAKYGIIEAVVNFDEIYPHRTGTISAVNADDLCKFSDDSLDFDVNAQLIEGVVAKLTFTSGTLSGQEFELHAYDHATKTFDIVKRTDGSQYVFPNENFKLSVGDKYVLTSILMPQSYIDEAEEELQKKATEYIEKYCTPQATYEIELDYVKLRRDSIELNVGDITTTVDKELGISASTRIISLTQILVSPSKYTIKVGDKATITRLKRVLAKQVELDIALKVEKKDRQADYRRMRRSLLQIAELQESIFDQDGYFDTRKIKPLSIETRMLSVGSRSLRMSFEGLQIKPNYNGNAKLVNISASKLVHFTITEKVREWNFNALTLTLDDAKKYYYLYAKCHKEGVGGVYYATTAQLPLENNTYYYFLIGVIHSEIEGVRGASLQYGQTFINGKFITTGVIKSANGNLVIDLENGTVTGGIKFSSGTSLEDWAEKQENISERAKNSATQANGVAEQAKNTADEARIKANAATSEANAALNSANSVEGKIQSLKIGGVNLLNNYNDFSKWVVELGVNISNNGRFSSSKKGSWGIYQEVAVTRGTDYTLSLKSTNRKGLKVSVGAGSSIWSGLVRYTSVEKDFFVLNFNSGEHTKVRIYLSAYNSGSATLVSVQLEEGTKTTAHRTSETDREKKIESAASTASRAKSTAESAKITADEAKEEASSAKKSITLLDYLKDAFKKTTEVLGGIVFTSVLALRNSAGKVTAYVNGNSSSNNNAFAAGVENFGTSDETSKTSITHDGKLISKQAEIEGEIVARKGRIGDFKIDGGSLNSGDSKKWGGELSLYQSGVIFRQDTDKVFAGFGENVFPAVLGYRGHLRVINKGADSAVGAMIEVRPTRMYFGDTSKALIIDGNTKTTGGHCKYDDTYIGIAHTDTITEHIGVTHQFLFTGVASRFNAVKLPSKSQIDVHTGGKDVTFLLEITMGKGCYGKTIQIQGVEGGEILHNDGGNWRGGKGICDMEIGDVLTLRYHNGYYYLASHRN